MTVSASFESLTGKGFARRVGFGRRAALLVIDFINGFTDPTSSLGADVGNEIAQTNRLIAVARTHSLPVLFSTIRYDEENCRDAGLWLEKIGGLSALTAAGVGWHVDPRLTRRPNDALIVKKFASCFFGTSLLSRLVHDGIDTLVLAGCTTSGCVRATAVDACQSGFRVIVAREAVADRLELAHQQSLTDINLKYGDCCSVDDILAQLKTLHHGQGLAS